MSIALKQPENVVSVRGFQHYNYDSAGIAAYATIEPSSKQL